MTKIKATVAITEVLTLEKVVEVEVDHIEGETEADQQERIEQAGRAKACERIVTYGDHGWAPIESEGFEYDVTMLEDTDA